MKSNRMLIDASIKGNLNEIKDALNNGADINYKDEDGLNALNYSLCNDHLTISKFLLDNGIDVNSKDDEKFSIMHYVALDGNDQAVNLLQYGAKPNEKDFYGFTPYDYALTNQNNNYKKVLEILECNTK